MDIESIAQIAHQTNKAFCQVTGDTPQPDWEYAPQWQKESAIAGVQAYIDNPSITPEQSHENWMALKFEQGWVYGQVKDVESLEHPCMTSYDDLPHNQKLKDTLFLAIVRALT